MKNTYFIRYGIRDGNEYISTSEEVVHKTIIEFNSNDIEDISDVQDLLYKKYIIDGFDPEYLDGPAHIEILTIAKI